MALDAYSIITTLLTLLAFLLSLPPMAVHIRARNFAAAVVATGSAVLSVQNFINVLTWPSDDDPELWNGKILCDVEVKLYIGIGLAIDGALLCLFRQISIVLDTDRMTVVPSPEQQRLKRAIEIFLCIILPCFVMAAHYLVQPTRYDLRILAGCTPSFDNSWPSVLLVFIWPALVCVIASVYCAVSLVRLWKHRQQMSSVLSSTPGLSQARFTRLFVFASVLLLCYLPLALVAFAENLMIHLHIYSWSYIHPPDWASTISLVRPKNITFDRWAQVFTAYVLFGFYGWGDEARQTYLSALHGVRSAIAKCFEWLGLPQLQRAGTTRSVSARPSRTIEDQTSVLRMREMPHRVEATDAADRC